MASAFVQSLYTYFGDLMALLPTGILLTVAPAFIEGGKYLRSFRHELIGSILMIGCTFSAGKWFGTTDYRQAWAGHLVGVICADYFGGGPHVNPAVTAAMFALSKVTYTEAYVRVAGQLAGGLIAFPLFHAVSIAFKLNPFGGPEFNASAGYVDPFVSEFSATLCLMIVIYLLNWELHFGKYHYIIKQSLTAVAIRALIEGFPRAGPAMNPMLATAWGVFGVGPSDQYPADFAHYFVYWIAPFLGAIVSTLLYTVYAGGTVFGAKLPIGPFKKAVPKKKSD